eukprot:scaffold29501_cov100-Isochrysis_galbana.AAC.5
MWRGFVEGVLLLPPPLLDSVTYVDMSRSLMSDACGVCFFCAVVPGFYENVDVRMWHVHVTPQSSANRERHSRPPSVPPVFSNALALSASCTATRVRPPKPLFLRRAEQQGPIGVILRAGPVGARGAVPGLDELAPVFRPREPVEQESDASFGAERLLQLRRCVGRGPLGRVHRGVRRVGDRLVGGVVEQQGVVGPVGTAAGGRELRPLPQPGQRLEPELLAPFLRVELAGGRAVLLVHHRGRLLISRREEE